MRLLGWDLLDALVIFMPWKVQLASLIFAGLKRHHP